MTIGSAAEVVAADPTAGDREVYVVAMDRSSRGRLFLAPTEPSEGVQASEGLSVRGSLLNRSVARRARMLLVIENAAGERVHSTDLTLEAEEGTTPFGFDWPSGMVPDGDYGARLVIIDPVLGEEARADWRVYLRSRENVDRLVERARELIDGLETGNVDFPVPAQRSLQLAKEALAPFPSAERPLIEADLNARFAIATVDSVRAHAALGGYGAKTTSSGTESGTGGGVPESTAGRMIGGVILGAGRDADARLAGMGFTFAPHMLNAEVIPPPRELREAPAMPTMVWISGFDEPAQPKTAGQLQLATSLAPAVVSLWTAPRISVQGEEARSAFQAYVEGVYGDRLELNRAWRQHLFGFGEVEITPLNSNRAYQFDYQSFRRLRTTQWIAEQLRDAAGLVAPAVATLTFTEGMLLPGESRHGLDTEGLTATLPVIAVRTAGPLEDDRYAQRFPEAQLMWALMRSFAPGRPLVALHSVDFALGDRLRGDSAAQLRTLAIEAAIEGVSAIAVEFPTLDDPTSGAPEALAGFAQALRELSNAETAVAALSDAPATVAVLWSDSSKILDDGAEHLEALVRAYDGCSFGGEKVGFITERQLTEGRWHSLKVVVLPQVTALGREAFAALESLVASGVAVVRTDAGPTYDEHGRGLGMTLALGREAVLVRGRAQAHDFLDALDDLFERRELTQAPRPVSASGFPIEGVKSRYVETATGRYLYVVNLRKDAVSCRFARDLGRATDVLTGRAIDFPRTVEPLEPLILELDGTAETD